MSDKGALLRVTRTTQGKVLVDTTGKLPGRGAYLCGKKKCLETAIKHRKLSRALRCEIPEEIVSQLQRLADDMCDNDR